MNKKKELNGKIKRDNKQNGKVTTESFLVILLLDVVHLLFCNFTPKKTKSKWKLITTNGKSMKTILLVLNGNVDKPAEIQWEKK